MNNSKSNVKSPAQGSRQLSKKIITPFERLKKRLLREFHKKKLIGDIIIRDFEYEILMDYFKSKCSVLFISNTQTFDNDPIFAITLVQIGIKHYDGNFWTHVAEVLGVRKINVNHQRLIGDLFINTLSYNDKIMLDKSERVNNILMHGFVSDYYANEMFEFLFKFYNIDLERDLQRNNSEMMNNLIKVIKKNDNTARTYLLVKQTSNAISTNIRGGKIRIRYLLKLIDKCFWEQITPINSISRLSVLFITWQENSDEFKLQYSKYHNNVNYGRKKSYFSPYIKCDFHNTFFKIVLPTQLIKFEFENDVKWNVYNNGNYKIINVLLYPAVTGYKTETAEISIETEDIFNEFIIELTYHNNRIRLFKIKSDCIRFFDKDGIFLDSDSNLPKGEVYAFTKENETPISEALVENEPINKLVRSYFKFEYGDIVRLPDGRPLSIGKKLEEGLLSRKVLSACYTVKADDKIPIYSVPPVILLKIAPHKANGTLIEINGIRHRLFDKETTIIELDDRSGEIGYIINLIDYGCIEDELYTVFVDVPNDRTNRYWQFALINGISYEFEDAPYIFNSKGTIHFNEELDIMPKYSSIVAKNSDENSFNFFINSDIDFLQFEFKIKASIIDLYFDIPVFKWKLGKGQWRIERPSDIWHADFPSLIYIKYPDDIIKISMDEQIDYESNTSEQSITYVKTKTKDIFECDTTRFKSWFGREKVARSIFIDLPRNRIEFVKVITQSIIDSHILKVDFEASKLIGEIDIIGKANYYVDVILLDSIEKLAEKMPVIDGKFVIDRFLKSGMYKVSVFEDEEDETGFEIASYLLIGEYEHNLINPYNLQGKSIALKKIYKNTSSSIYFFSCQYIVCNLQLADEDDKYNYKGTLVLQTIDGYASIYNNVNVQFLDLDKLKYVSLSYFDGYDYIEFLYDTNRKIIVKEEEQGLKRAVRYRRYESLYPEDYVYVVEFTNKKVNIINRTELNKIKLTENGFAWKQNCSNDITIEQLALSMKTYNCLHRAKIKTARDIEKMGVQALFKVRNLGCRGVNEIIAKMREKGFNMDEIEVIEKDTIAVSIDEQAVHSMNERASENKEILASNDSQQQSNVLDTPISEIELSMFVLNCLKKAKVITVRDIVEKGTKKILNINGFNNKMYKEVVQKLNAIGVLVK